MSNTYAGKLSTKWISALTDVGELSSITDTVGDDSYIVNYTLTNGAAAHGAQVHWSDRATMTASATANIDLKSLTHKFGTVSMSIVKAMAVHVTSTTAAVQLTVGEPTSNTFAAVKGTIGPSGLLSAVNEVDGWAVTADTNDLIGVENTGTGSLAYEIIIIGAGSVT